MLRFRLCIIQFVACRRSTGCNSIVGIRYYVLSGIQQRWQRRWRGYMGERSKELTCSFLNLLWVARKNCNKKEHKVVAYICVEGIYFTSVSTHLYWIWALFLQRGLFLSIYKCGHRNVLSKRQVWISIFHIINFKRKKIVDTGVLDFVYKN